MGDYYFCSKSTLVVFVGKSQNLFTRKPRLIATLRAAISRGSAEMPAEARAPSGARGEGERNRLWWTYGELNPALAHAMGAFCR